MTIKRDGSKITVATEVAFQKRFAACMAHQPLCSRRASYLKYLTKKFLKKHTLRDYLRVVATNKATYDIRYFNNAAADQDAAE